MTADAAPPEKLNDSRAILARYERCQAEGHDWQPDKRQAGDRCIKCEATRNAPEHYP